MKRFLRVCTTTLCMLLMFSLCLMPAGAASKKKTTTKKVTINPPGNFHSTATGNKSAVFRWNIASGAEGYGIFKYDNETGTYKLIGKTKGNSYDQRIFTAKKLKDGVEYKFYIKSYRKSKGKVIWSKPSPTVKVTGKAFSAAVKSVHGAYYKVTTNKATTATVVSTGKKIKLKKGTSLTVTAKSGTTVTGYTKNNTKIKISRSALKYVGLNITSSEKSDYSTKTKEDYVNSKNYSSPSKWLIWLSQYKCRVNVFTGSRGNWKLVKSFPCSVGTWVHRTAGGMRRILDKQRYSKYGPYPIMHFSSGTGTPQNPKGCAFHYYNSPGMMNKPGVLGASVSNGCVRMTGDALMYLYNNCPVGTTVVSI